MSSKWVNVALWIVQVFLALFFLAAGIGRAVMPIAHMAAVPGLEWTPAVPVPLLRFIGVVEALGAIGVILPAATRIRPMLTPLAAAGLAVVMVLAAGFHLVRHEPGLGTNALWCSVAAIVVWGRWKLHPIEPRHCARGRRIRGDWASQ